MTAHSHPPYVQRIIDAGADAVVTKPYDDHALLETLLECLNAGRAHHA
ncbi:MAG: hypothetical protein ACOC0O_03255 [Spirochaetota bacterium]